MAGYKPRVISLTKRSGDTFGFFLRVEQNEEGHLIRSLEMGSPAELAGMKDGDRILRVNGIFVDELSHSEVVDLVRNSGASVIFYILDEKSYKQAKAQGVKLCDPHNTTVANGVSKQAPKPKLCYLVRSSTGYGFSLRSVKGEQGLYMTEVTPGGVADRAGVRINDRLLEINGETIDGSTHDQAVDMIKSAGSRIMFLLVDAETEKYYQNKQIKVGAWCATTKYLPHNPRIIEMTKGPDGYGFLLKERLRETGHFITDIDRGSPAARAGLLVNDRVVAVNGRNVDDYSHDQVVDRIKQGCQKCTLLVVNKEAEEMFTQANVSPMIFWEETNDSVLPPSYTEAVTASTVVLPPTPPQESQDNPKPKLCKMEKSSAGFGFHLNGVQGVCGQYIKEVVKDGVADRAGLEDDDIVVEVNSVNVENSHHNEVVALIHASGHSLEMLVASKSVYDQLKAKGVAITRHLLGETSYAQVHATATPEDDRKEEPKHETPTEPQRERTPSVSSSSSQDSIDERL